MEKTYVMHYILATYGDDETSNYRNVNMAKVVDRYEAVTERILNAMRRNDIEEPEKLITYSFRMLGDFRDGVYHRKELVDINLEVLKEDLVGFPWENWEWVQAFQPLIDVAGYTVVEIDAEYPHFGPSVDKPVDHIAPCYRIYESGRHDYSSHEGKGSTYEHEKDVEAKGWFKRFKKDVLAPVGESIRENIPTVFAIVTTAAAVVVMTRSSSESLHIIEQATLHSNEVLRHIEEAIEDAVEMPQIVKVEIGDDMEYIGRGQRTW